MGVSACCFLRSFQAVHLGSSAGLHRKCPDLDQSLEPISNLCACQFASLPEAQRQPHLFLFELPIGVRIHKELLQALPCHWGLLIFGSIGFWTIDIVEPLGIPRKLPKALQCVCCLPFPKTQ